MRKKKEKRGSFFREIIEEFAGSIIVEVVWKIIIFVPRLIIRAFSSTS